jgi:serine/threonine protein kinase
MQLGNFGTVYLGEWNLAEIALKKLRNDEDVKAFIHEVKIARKLICPNVVTVYGVSLLDDDIYVLMQYCSNSDLKSYLLVRNK